MFCNGPVFLVDDMVDTAGTLCKAAGVLKDKGARRVYAFATHGLFSGGAPKKIANSVLTELVCLDTVRLSDEAEVKQPTILHFFTTLCAKHFLLHFDRPPVKLLNYLLVICWLLPFTIFITRRVFLLCSSSLGAKVAVCRDINLAGRFVQVGVNNFYFYLIWHSIRSSILVVHHDCVTKTPLLISHILKGYYDARHKLSNNPLTTCQNLNNLQHTVTYNESITFTASRTVFNNVYGINTQELSEKTQ